MSTAYLLENEAAGDDDGREHHDRPQDPPL